LPVETSEKHSAPGFRAWYFGRALAEAGHKVRLVSLGSNSIQVPRLIADNLLLYAIPEAMITDQNYLEEMLAERMPDAVVGSGVRASYLATLYLPRTLPLWSDLFGSPLAEAQAKAAVYRDDSVIEPFLRFERAVLERADAFSAVSVAQQHAIEGELGHCGRLNAATYGYRFVWSIPASADFTVLPHNRNILRGKIVPDNAFVALWSGGYNTWTDVDTLFAGLDHAMAQNPDLHFVSTGGALPPHDAATYPRFCQLVETSEYFQRYHLLDWQPLETLHNFYLEANLGIILDKWSYEAVLGSRTRLVDWLKYGLPAIATRGAELVTELENAGAIYTFPHGDSDRLGALLGDLAKSPQSLKAASEQGQRFVREHYNYKVTAVPLLEWAASPRNAPASGNSSDSRLDLEKKLATLENQLEAKNAHISTVEHWAHEMETRLKQLEASPLNRWWCKVRSKFS